MKKYLLSLAVLVMFATPAHAFTVTCTNCSNMLVQMLDRVTNVEQLTSMIKQYQEAVEQTRQQINMVRQNIEQYENMLQNTAKLPANLVNELKNSLTRLANLSSTLRTQRGDIVALGEIFNNLVPGAGALRNIGRGRAGTGGRSQPPLPGRMEQVVRIRGSGFAGNFPAFRSAT